MIKKKDSLEEMVLSENETHNPHNPNFKTKLYGWIKRYFVPEIVSILFAYTASYLTYDYTNNEIAAAYGATIATSFGFYGTVLVRDIKKDCGEAKKKSEQYGLKGLAKTVRNLIFEFGIAELIDVGITRPAATLGAVNLFGRGIGVIVGKIAADVVFYVPAIIAYETRKKIF